MKRFPAEFEALLSPRGRRLLAASHPAHGVLARDTFFTATGLLDPRQLTGCTRLLAKTFTDLLVEQASELPSPESAIFSHGDRLPKVGRQSVVPSAGAAGATALARAEDIGLKAMVFSESFRAFARALAGRALTEPFTAQVLCYRPHDYVGPHTDFHPSQPALRDGYVDVHLTFCTAGVTQQFLVYAKNGHLSEQRSIAASGTVTAYRLPFWHYTTPLQARRASDRRWIVMGSFADA